MLALYHTGVVVKWGENKGVEYWFGGDIMVAPAGPATLSRFGVGIICLNSRVCNVCKAKSIW